MLVTRVVLPPTSRITGKVRGHNILHSLRYPKLETILFFDIFMSTSNMDFKHRLIMLIYPAEFLLLLQLCELAWVFLEFTKQCRKLHLQLESELKGKGYLTVRYSGTSIWESAKRLAKFVRYNKVSLCQGSFSYVPLLGWRKFFVIPRTWNLKELHYMEVPLYYHMGKNIINNFVWHVN